MTVIYCLDPSKQKLNAKAEHITSHSNRKRVLADKIVYVSIHVNLDYNISTELDSSTKNILFAEFLFKNNQNIKHCLQRISLPLHYNPI